MKLFAINETEWVVANTQEEAIEYEGLEPEEVKSIEEIPEAEWEEEVECYIQDDLHELEDSKPVFYTIRKIIELAAESGLPRKIMTECD